jgi:hypothetical protein
VRLVRFQRASWSAKVRSEPSHGLTTRFAAAVGAVGAVGVQLEDDVAGGLGRVGELVLEFEQRLDAVDHAVAGPVLACVKIGWMRMETGAKSCWASAGMRECGGRRAAGGDEATA